MGAKRPGCPYGRSNRSGPQAQGQVRCHGRSRKPLEDHGIGGDILVSGAEGPASVGE